MKYKFMNPRYIKENIVNVNILIDNQWVLTTVDMKNPGSLADLKEQLDKEYIPKSEEFEITNKDFKLNNINIRYNNLNFIVNKELKEEIIQGILLNFENTREILINNKIENLSLIDFKNILKLIDIKERIIKGYKS